MNPLIDRVREVFAAGDEPVEVVLVFGSVARDTENRESDVDVGVIFRGAVSLEQELALQGRIERAVSRPVDLVRLDEADLLLRWRAVRDGIVVYSNPPYAASRFMARTGIEHDETSELREDAMQRYARAVAAGR